MPRNAFGVAVLILAIYTTGLVTDIAQAEQDSVRLSYTLLDSALSGDSETRVYELQIQNLTPDPMESGRAILRRAPAFIAILDAEVSFGWISEGVTVQGLDTFTIKIDTKAADSNSANVSFVWEIVHETSDGWDEILHEDDVGPLAGF